MHPWTGEAGMQWVSVILVLINVATIATPFAVVAVTYQSNLSELVAPPQITQIMDNTFAGDQIQLPIFVGAAIDNVSRTAILTFNFTNPLNYNLTLKEVTADVQCSAHNSTLGNVYVDSLPVFIPAAETVQIKVVCAWTTQAETHFAAEHAGASSVDVSLVNLKINVNEIVIQMSEPIGIPNVPITTSALP